MHAVKILLIGYCRYCRMLQIIYGNHEFVYFRSCGTCCATAYAPFQDVGSIVDIVDIVDIAEVVNIAGFVGLVDIVHAVDIVHVVDV